MNGDSMKSDCMNKELLASYACGMVEADEETKVRAHVADCERCREIVEGYERVSAALDEWRPQSPWPSPGFDSKLRVAIDSIAGRHRAALNARGLSWAWLLAAAVTLLFAAAALTVIHARHSERMSARHALPESVQQNAQAASKASQPNETTGPETASGLNASTAASATVESGQAALQTAEASGTAEAAQDDDMLASFDVLLELPKPRSRQVDN